MTTDRGQSLKRFEDPRLVTGMGSFVEDITFPNITHAVVIRSPHAHAVIRAIDASMAQALPGVLATLTGADIDGVLADLPLRPFPANEAVIAMNAPTHPVLG